MADSMASMLAGLVAIRAGRICNWANLLTYFHPQDKPEQVVVWLHVTRTMSTPLSAAILRIVDPILSLLHHHGPLYRASVQARTSNNLCLSLGPLKLGLLQRSNGSDDL